MKKFLPKEKGFSLVELLVVITIMAILASIGLVIFTGTQKSARDTKRKADITDVTKALEMNKTSVGYQPLSVSSFASGNIPANDPSNKPYCIVANSATADPANWFATGSCPSGWSQLSNAVPAANSTSFKICASLEASTAVFCEVSRQ